SVIAPFVSINARFATPLIVMAQSAGRYKRSNSPILIRAIVIFLFQKIAFNASPTETMMEKTSNADQVEQQQAELKAEQRATARELAELMQRAQQMGRRLASETRGGVNDEVRFLNELLQQTYIKAEAIRKRLMYDGPR